MSKRFFTARAIVIHPALPKRNKKSTRLKEDLLKEAVGLALAINLQIVSSKIITINIINSGTFLGKGIIEKLKESILYNKINLIIINHPLTPIQQRNLEGSLSCKVIDRTALILEIFGKRAITREGSLQVELASLNYQKSRLVRSWTHLERQRGGYGFLGGPGERQIESDRRIISKRIIRISNELSGLKRMRTLHRRSRRKSSFPIVVLVGYTNAGKSTLFNYLTKENSFSHDMLFSTLDPKMKKLKLPSGRQIILSDTVGFISDLPTHLIDAFQSTLEEILEADLIIHVRDCHHQETHNQKDDVEKVLQEIGFDSSKGIILEAMNKIDLFDSKAEPSNDRYSQSSMKNKIYLSAKSGEGCKKILLKIDDVLSEKDHSLAIKINNDDGKMLSWLHRNGNILSQNIDSKYVFLKLELSEENLGRLKIKAKSSKSVELLYSNDKDLQNTA